MDEHKELEKTFHIAFGLKVYGNEDYRLYNIRFHIDIVTSS